MFILVSLENVTDLINLLWEFVNKCWDSFLLGIEFFITIFGYIPNLIISLIAYLPSSISSLLMGFISFIVMVVVFKLISLLKAS